jgi:MFS family permease
VLIAAGLAIAIAFPATDTATFGFLLVGFGTSSVVPIAFGLAGKSNTMTASTALATVSSISFLGFLIGPPMIGFMAQGFSLQISFAVVALLGLGTAFFSGKIKLSND